MNTKLIQSISLAVIAIFCVSFFGLRAQTAHAQEPEGPKRIAILDVPGGGSDLLSDAVSKLDNVVVEDQAWFLEQIQGRAFKAKGIMSRPEDLKWLMDGAKITYILYLAAGEDDASPYTARLVGAQTGEPVHQFTV